MGRRHPSILSIIYLLLLLFQITSFLLNQFLPCLPYLFHFTFPIKCDYIQWNTLIFHTCPYCVHCNPPLFHLQQKKLLPLFHFQQENLLPLFHLQQDNLLPLFHLQQEKLLSLFHLQQENFLPLFHLKQENLLPLFHLQQENLLLLFHLQQENILPLFHLQQENLLPLFHHQQEKLLPPNSVTWPLWTVSQQSFLTYLPGR